MDRTIVCERITTSDTFVGEPFLDLIHCDSSFLCEVFDDVILGVRVVNVCGIPLLKELSSLSRELRSCRFFFVLWYIVVFNAVIDVLPIVSAIV